MRRSPLSEFPPAAPAPDSQVERKSPWLRLSLFAPIMVTDRATGRLLRTPTAELDEYDCFVQTATPFRKGTMVIIEIAHRGELFGAYGVVVYTNAGGMEIVFSSVEAESRQILDSWLRGLKSH